MSFLTPSEQPRESAGESTSGLPVFTPPVDIYETADDLVLLADLPGVDRERINVDLEEDVLTIGGEMKPPETTGEQVANEFQAGRYHRRFTLAVDVDRDNIRATYKDGVLKLTLPKAAKAKPQCITVQAG